jgi:hypothetical protein
MHKKILLLSDRDQFTSFDYNSSYSSAMTEFGGNSGNGVFQFAVQKILQSKNVNVDIYELGKLRNYTFKKDIDLCWRAQNSQHSIKYVGDSTVYHVGGATLKEESPRKIANACFQIEKVRNTANSQIII